MDASLGTYVTAALASFAITVAPPLIAALVVGLIVSILQAATQIQDQTLPQTFKLAAVFGALVVFGPVLVGSIVDLGTRVFTDFPAIVR